MLGSNFLLLTIRILAHQKDTLQITIYIYIYFHQIHVFIVKSNALQKNVSNWPSWHFLTKFQKNNLHPFHSHHSMSGYTILCFLNLVIKLIQHIPSRCFGICRQSWRNSNSYLLLVRHIHRTIWTVRLHS